jgi:hypothetical protein
MGRKITIDSATMFNKALEIIEAFHLFELEADQIDVLVHPQSIIHGLVEFSDRSVVAQMGAPDMRTPIAHCLGWPHRIDGPEQRLDLATLGQLTFEAPDPVRFPALRLVQGRCGQAARHRPCSTRPTRLRSPRSSIARFRSAASRGSWKRRSRRWWPRERRRRRKAPTRLWLLTILREKPQQASCLKLP